VDITKRGIYVAPSGREIDLRARIAAAVRGTVEHLPHEPIPLPPRGRSATRTFVTNGTSLGSARALAAKGHTPMVLNFASAKNPGGGFLNGARAQEESLARSSALHACLEGQPMYMRHRVAGDPAYTSTMIWSPPLPVFRDDEAEGDGFLEEPYDAAFLTAPAPNAKVALERDPARRDEIACIMHERILRALTIAAHHGERHLVLGAWGAGVFGNDPALVAEGFHAALRGPFVGVFEIVVFAVLDFSDERRFVRPFAERFA